MKTWMVILIGAIALAAGAGGGYWWGHRSSGAKTEDAAPETAKEEDKPVAAVKVVPIRKAAISRFITAYGSVVSPASDVRVVSVPYESRVTKVYVPPGETVEANQPLIGVEASAGAALALQEATNTATAAERDYQSVKKRFDQKLATNADLFAAENARTAANARLASLKQSGAGSAATLKSESAGIVSKVDAQIGQIVPAGGPLVEIAGRKQIEVKLGVEPANVGFLAIGQPVKLHLNDAGDTDTIDGKIRMIGQRIDPTSRLVDVIVSFAGENKLLLETFVTAQLEQAAPAALIVPRAALVPGDGDDFKIFTIKDGQAVEHKVQVGIDDGKQVQITAADIQEGDSAVILGNAELENGMKVKAEAEAPAGDAPAADTPATDAPSPDAPAPAKTPKSPGASAGSKSSLAEARQ